MLFHRRVAPGVPLPGPEPGEPRPAIMRETKEERHPHIVIRTQVEQVQGDVPNEVGEKVDSSNLFYLSL